MGIGVSWEEKQLDILLRRGGFNEYDILYEMMIMINGNFLLSQLKYEEHSNIHLWLSLPFLETPEKVSLQETELGEGSFGIGHSDLGNSPFHHFRSLHSSISKYPNSIRNILIYNTYFLIFKHEIWHKIF